MMALNLFSPPTGEKVFFAPGVAITPIVGARVAGAANCRFFHDKKIERAQFCEHSNQYSTE
jgi:hypothetical protein